MGVLRQNFGDSRQRALTKVRVISGPGLGGHDFQQGLGGRDDRARGCKDSSSRRWYQSAGPTESLDCRRNVYRDPCKCTRCENEARQACQ